MAVGRAEMSRQETGENNIISTAFRGCKNREDNRAQKIRGKRDQKIMLSRGEPEGQHEIPGPTRPKSEGEAAPQDSTAQNQILISILIFKGWKVWDRSTGDLSLQS